MRTPPGSVDIADDFFEGNLADYYMDMIDCYVWIQSDDCFSDVSTLLGLDAANIDKLEEEAQEPYEISLENLRVRLMDPTNMEVRYDASHPIASPLLNMDGSTFSVDIDEEVSSVVVKVSELDGTYKARVYVKDREGEFPSEPQEAFDESSNGQGNLSGVGGKQVIVPVINPNHVPGEETALRLEVFAAVITGKLMDFEGRILDNISVTAVAEDGASTYSETVQTDEDGVFVFNNFPVDQGDVYIKVWQTCYVCSELREGPGAMIPSQQLLLHTRKRDITGIWPDDTFEFRNGFPVMMYRAKTSSQPLLPGDMLDFGTVEVEYVSIELTPMTVSGLRGATLGVWGSFLGDRYRPIGYDPNDPSYVYTDYTPPVLIGDGHHYNPGLETTLEARCYREPPFWTTENIVFTYFDYLRMKWNDLPRLRAGGRDTPAFDDVDGQIIGFVDYNLWYEVDGGHSLKDSEVDGPCWCTDCPVYDDMTVLDVQVEAPIKVKVYK